MLIIMSLDMIILVSFSAGISLSYIVVSYIVELSYILSNSKTLSVSLYPMSLTFALVQ